VVAVNEFSYGVFNPIAAYAVSCLGAFLGLCCVTRGRIRGGLRRASWLGLAAVSIGGTGIWAMHFIAMLGFSIPSQLMEYNLPITFESLALSIVVVGAGLFIVGYGRAGWLRLLSAGVLVGVGVAGMHYRGMDAMNMTMRYNPSLVGVSIAIAIVAGTAALWAGLHVRGLKATIWASLIMGVAVTGMHYTGMYAMTVTGGATSDMSGSSAFVVVVPLLVAFIVFTSGLAFAISAAPTEKDIAEDESLQRRIDEAVQSGKITLAPEPGPRTSGGHDWALQVGSRGQTRAAEAFRAASDARASGAFRAIGDPRPAEVPRPAGGPRPADAARPAEVPRPADVSRPGDVPRPGAPRPAGAHSQSRRRKIV
jgi:NO-binding membrane sensor protein with MHYT domain